VTLILPQKVDDFANICRTFDHRSLIKQKKEKVQHWLKIPAVMCAVTFLRNISSNIWLTAG